MKKETKQIYWISLLFLSLLLALTGCAQEQAAKTDAKEEASAEPDTSRFIVAVEDELDTVDFQCTSIHYTVAQNVFDRLIEMNLRVL